MKSREVFQETRYEKQHVITIRGERINFLSIAEDYVLSDDNGEVEASMFSYSYIRCVEETQNARPVLFVWNGGPGGSVAIENLSLFSPWRIRSPQGKTQPALNPPFALEENPNCLLDLCDLVLVDPVGTGYGTIQKESAYEKYCSVSGDAEVMADFIESWLTEHGRWNSPRYLCGTSYGTIRCARVLEALNGGAFRKNSFQRSISVNGVILIGQSLAVNATATSMLPEGVEPTLLLFRSMAAANAYHNKVADDIEAYYQEADRWAWATLPAVYEKLERGELSEEESAAAAEQMAQYIGIPAPMLQQLGFKIPAAEMFAAVLLAGQGQDIGIYDSRMTLRQSDRIGLADPSGDDPAMSVYTPAVISVMNGFMKERLGIDFRRRYADVNFNVNMRWNWAYPETIMPEIPARDHAQCIAAAMRRNENMKVLFATGMYDLCTWMGTNRYIAEQSGFAPERTVVREYPAGHMVFLDTNAAEALAADIRKLIAETR
ncbi:MAG: hypothetical protein IJQ02_00980 [Oscillospiraceae bacterium]|nr:hypothetical protein [Oscillospiraceae bacterium]